MKRIIAIWFLLLIVGVAIADISGSTIVIDGDTIEIRGTHIRLSGIDTPERGQTCYRDGKKWLCGLEATKLMRQLTWGKDVYCKGNVKDRWDRLIANCYADGIDINATMVELGMAVAYRQYSMEFVENEKRARRNKRGLWAGHFVLPWDWRNGKRLHQPQITEPLMSCCKICRKGKACGNSCISRSYTCHKSPGCACNAN